MIKFIMIALFMSMILFISCDDRVQHTTYHQFPPPYCMYNNIYYIQAEHKFISAENSSDILIPHKCFPYIEDKREKRHFSHERHNVATLDPNLAGRLKSNVVTVNNAIFFFEKVGTNEMVRHFFHVFEHLMGTWAFWGQNDPNSVDYIILAGDGRQDHWTIHDFIISSIKHLFPNAKLVTWLGFQSAFRHQHVVFKKIFISDRKICDYDRNCGPGVNMILGAAKNHIDHSVIEKLTQRFHARDVVIAPRQDAVRVMYIIRHKQPYLTPTLEKLLLDELRRIHHVSLTVVDFAKQSVTAQLAMVANTDIFIGVHGNGLSHIIFAPKHAVVIELFPYESYSLDYLIYSEIKSLKHYTVLPKLGILSNSSSYHLGAMGNIHSEIEEFDVDLVASIVHVEVARIITKEVVKTIASKAN